MRVKIIIGTRPEAIKLIPVYLLLKNKTAYEVQIIATGQHTELLHSIFDFFSIKPEVEVLLNRKDNSLGELTAQLFEKLNKILSSSSCDLCLVQGDTTSAWVASMCSFYNGIKIGHIEAGLRTGDRYSPFPEEINRKFITQIANYHFSPTQHSLDNLQAENIEGKKYLVGNTVIDALQLGLDIIDRNKDKYHEAFSPYLRSNNNNILLTTHRRENIGAFMNQICKAVISIAECYPEMNVVLPVHSNPNVQETVNKYLKGISNVKLMSSLDYGELLYVLKNCKLTITDSGGIQEEAPSLNIPVVVIRKSTERPEGISAGCAVLAGTDADSILQTVKNILDNKKVYQKMANSPNPYGDGLSSLRIVRALEEEYG